MRRLALLVLLAATADADERILGFDAEITVNADSSLAVTETITVRSERNRILRGIYRDFPTDYADAYGNRVRVDYEPLAVTRNDRPETFFSKPLSRGVRTYFGDENTYLDAGVYVYRFRYRVDRILGYFDSHDELYWNVTGNDWSFPIDHVEATVELAFEGAPSVSEATGYTGFSGDRGADYIVEEGRGRAHFVTTRGLAAHEGLTIVVTWPKGFVAPPGQLEQFVDLLADNASLLAVAVGFALMLAYLVPVWRRFGRDPEEGVIVTRYEPPPDLPPASLRYVRQMYYDNKVMTAAVVSLAVKGWLHIEESGGDFTLIRQRPDGAPDLPASEQALYSALFLGGDRLELDDKYHERIGRARKDHRNALRREFHGRYFRTNGLLNLPSYAIAVVAAIIAIRIDPPPTPFVLGGIGILILTNVFFTTLMRRPTVIGRQLLDEVLGFRDYLDVAEKDELNLRNPPEKTPELFERYLPFALALGVEQDWAERFAAVVGKAGDPDDGRYRPGWYSGRFRSGSLHRATSRLSSGLTSSISSSATPPGSSSGSGGGGSSGGGGGGGGGGGW